MSSEEAEREEERRAKNREERAAGLVLTPEEAALVPPEIGEAANILDQLIATLEAAGNRYEAGYAFTIRGLTKALRHAGDSIGSDRAARKRFGDADS